MYEPLAKKILLLGKNGQVGWELKKSLTTLGTIIALDINDLDLSQPKQIRQSIRQIKPDLIVNAAAYTSVEQAESEIIQAISINGNAPGILAEEAKRIGAGLIHYSSDYVFDGHNRLPYTEKDEPNPINIYGKSKLMGEQAIQSVGGRYIILRSAWVYGTRADNFLLTILKRSQQCDEIRVVNDQFGTPTWSRTLAEMTSMMLARIYSSPSAEDEFEEKAGLYHLTASGCTSWAGFAQAIISMVMPRKQVRIIPISTDNYSSRAQRPLWSVLNCDKFIQSFQLSIPLWEESLAQTLSSLSTQTSAY